MIRASSSKEVLMRTGGELKKRPLLISAPWASLNHPSAQIGALKAYAEVRGFKVDAFHWYLDIADAIGSDCYESLCQYREELTGDLFYAKLLFPDADNSLKYSAIFSRALKHSKLTRRRFEKLLSNIRTTSKRLLDSCDWKEFSSVGFTVVPFSMMASLFYAKEIKKRAPNTKIVFGGFSCRNPMGESIIKTFPYIDYVVPGEGERPYTRIIRAIAKSPSSNPSVKGAWVRTSSGLRWGGDDQKIMKLDSLPSPNFDDYFSQIPTMKNIVVDPTLTFEASRSCPWGACRFCSEYGEKPHRWHSRAYLENMLRSLGRRYKTLKFICCDEAFPAEILYGNSAPASVEPLGSMTLSLRTTLKKSTLLNLYALGVRYITFGYESFSDRTLKQLNKGTKAIENIQTLKWCKELGIIVSSTFIYNYPGMFIGDIKQTIETIRSLPYSGMHFIFSEFLIQRGSEYFQRPDKYGITDIRPHPNETHLFPRSISKSLISYYHTHKSRGQKISRAAALRGERSPSLQLFRDELFYVDNSEILTLYRVHPYTRIDMCGDKRRLYIFCDSARSWSEITNELRGMSKTKIRRCLKSWSDEGLMIYDGSRYLAIAYLLRRAFI